VKAPKRKALLTALEDQASWAKATPQATNMTHKISPANRTALVRLKSASVLRSVSNRTLEIAAAERMKTENASRNGTAQLVLFDAKLRRKDATPA
jgi:hypothetical protein